jgi:small subunit ribosomal protein S6
VRPYEVMIIFDADLEESEIRAVLDRTTAAIRERGGNVERTERWGKRRFAYELAHRWEGYYVLVAVRAEAGALDDAERVLSLADEVLRHKVVRLPERAVGSSPAVAEAAANETS